MGWNDHCALANESFVGCTNYRWKLKALSLKLTSEIYASSHNHSSVQNGCVSNSSYIFYTFQTQSFSTSMIMGERVVLTFLLKKTWGPSFELTRALHIYVDPRGWFSFQLNIPHLERVTQYQDQGCSQERLEKLHIQSITSCRWSSWKIWTNPRNRTYSVITSWWFQPLWKILVKMGIFPK